MTFLLGNIAKKNRGVKLPMIKTWPIIFNGTSQKANGVNAVAGFDISGFISTNSTITFIIIPSTRIVGASSIAKTILEFSNLLRSSVHGIYFGNVTAGLTSEVFTLLSTSNGGTVTVTGFVAPTILEVGFYVVSLATDSSGTSIIINGSAATTTSGTLTNVINGPTELGLDRLYIGSTSTSANFGDFTLRELSFMSRKLSNAEAISLHGQYLSNPSISVKGLSLYSDANFVELYTGETLGTTTLLASKSSTRNLILTGF